MLFGMAWTFKAGASNSIGPHPRTSAIKRLIVVGLLLALLAAAWAAWWHGPAVPVEPVTRQAIVESVVATGRLQAPARIEIGAEVAGTVDRVGVREGEQVVAGQMLLTLVDAEARSALTQALAVQAEAAGRLAQQESLSAPVAQQAELQAQAAWWALQRDHGRVQELVSQGFYSPQRLDEARRALDVAASALTSAQLNAQAHQSQGIEPALARARLAQAQASVRIAQARLARLLIRSPVPARVLSRQVEPGAMAQPGRVLLVLAQAGDLHIDVSIDERHLHLLRLGMPASVVADAYPLQPFEARLCQIAPAVDPDRGALTARLCLSGAPPFLKPEMTVSAELVAGRQSSALVLPTPLVRDADQAQPWVLVLRQAHAVKVPVQLGLRGIGYSQITEGLNEADLVIAPTQGVLPGDRVRAGGPRAPAAIVDVPSFVR